nr:response regulator [Pseudomonas aegrilactucae]
MILAPPSLCSQALNLFETAGIEVLVTHDLNEMAHALDQGAGLAILADESLGGFVQSPVHHYLRAQPAWSDLPVVLLTSPAHAAHPTDADVQAALGNLFLLPCPFHSSGLLSLAHASLRARRRQYQARQHGTQLKALEQRVEEQLRHLQENEQQLRHTQKMEAIGQLAGGVAHDFNNLLTGIGGSLEMIRRRLAQGREQELPKLIDMSLGAVQRAAAMTHRLLAFSSRQPLDARPVDVKALLQRARLQPQLNPDITLQLTTDDDLWRAEADAQQLQEALDNLLSNARDAMPNGGELRIHACNRRQGKPLPGGNPLASGDYVLLSLHDNGCGMPQSTLDRAFDPFFTTKPIGQGTGLGLSMVYGFSRQSQGHVALYSCIGHGTRVELFLPRHIDGPAKQPAPAQAETRSGNRVMIVEDDATVRQLVHEALTEQGYQCTEMADASLALPVLRSSRPIDLLISDVGLPGMNGRQLAEIARKLRPGLKVLFITGYAENATSRMGFLDPGMQMINKPFKFTQLTRKVAQMLGRGKTP